MLLMTRVGLCSQSDTSWLMPLMRSLKSLEAIRAEMFFTYSILSATLWTWPLPLDWQSLKGKGEG